MRIGRHRRPVDATLLHGLRFQSGSDCGHGPRLPPEAAPKIRPLSGLTKLWCGARLIDRRSWIFDQGWSGEGFEFGLLERKAKHATERSAVECGAWSGGSPNSPRRGLGRFWALMRLSGLRVTPDRPRMVSGCRASRAAASSCSGRTIPPGSRARRAACRVQTGRSARISRSSRAAR